VHAIRTWSGGAVWRALAIMVLAVLFFTNIFLIFVSKTGLLMALALLALVLVQVGRWRRALLMAAAAGLVIGIALTYSPWGQARLEEFWADVHTEKPTSESIKARLDFWDKALGFVREAPLLGHGAGSIRPLYQTLEATRPSPLGEPTSDPHNQFFAVALQIGLVGGVLLLAMWAAHFAMFLGRDFARVLGQAVVLQNVLGSLFNSHLSTVTQGMLYCLAVGLLGAVIRNASLPEVSAADPVISA
jgi:O-antigen ligase